MPYTILLLFFASAACAQAPDPAVRWPTVLQGLQERLRTIAEPSAAEFAVVAKELAAVRQEIANTPDSIPLPPLHSPDRRSLGAAVDALRLALEDWQRETGHTHVVGRTLFDFALFRSEVSNSTQRFFVQPNVFQLRNLGEAGYQGGEASLRTSFTPALQWNANYTYLSRRNWSNPAQLMLDTPRHKVYSSLTYRLHATVNLLADARYEGGRCYQNDAGSFGRASRFASIGIGGSARLHKQVELQVGIDNLPDRNYFYVEGYPEAGRTAYVNLRYRF